MRRRAAQEAAEPGAAQTAEQHKPDAAPGSLSLTQIKQQAREENAKLDHLFTEKYIDHVEKYYEKKQQDRNLFKRKYLKINAL